MKSAEGDSEDLKSIISPEGALPCFIETKFNTGRVKCKQRFDVLEFALGTLTHWALLLTTQTICVYYITAPHYCLLFPLREILRQSFEPGMQMYSQETLELCMCLQAAFKLLLQFCYCCSLQYLSIGKLSII